MATSNSSDDRCAPSSSSVSHPHSSKRLGVTTRRRRRRMVTPTTKHASTACAAPPSNAFVFDDDDAYTAFTTDELADLVALEIISDAFNEDSRENNANNERVHPPKATRDNALLLCRSCQAEVSLVSNQVARQAQFQFPSSSRPLRTTAKTKKQYCTSCKNYLDSQIHFLMYRRTCITCLKKHKLYERRRRKRLKANTC